MQRTLIMIRHAKSSWANEMQPDFERPLNERGKREAEQMGGLLRKSGLLPQLIVSSSAKRTRQTAKRIAAETGYDEKNIVWVDKLYHCPAEAFEEVIYGLPDEQKVVFIVGHNPGITDFVNRQGRTIFTDHMPTCGIAGFHLDAERWTDYSVATKTLFLYEYPNQ